MKSTSALKEWYKTTPNVRYGSWKCTRADLETGGLHSEMKSDETLLEEVGKVTDARPKEWRKILHQTWMHHDPPCPACGCVFWPVCPARVDKDLETIFDVAQIYTLGAGYMYWFEHEQPPRKVEMWKRRLAEQMQGAPAVRGQMSLYEGAMRDWSYTYTLQRLAHTTWQVYFEQFRRLGGKKCLCFLRHQQQ